ncbi:YbbR-like domain-containing protein [Maribacter sp. 2210JD10-5]|uniref:CdaR family protein n=1 Tax=Maribacter sp. 2210JD10-5 TaxID=3386272 RepID=UPI0039BD4C02
MILERIKVGLRKRKVKVFLVFLLFSAFAWLVNSLSQSYVSNSQFNLVYVNVPDAFRLSNTPKATVDVKLKAVGFQFLGFAIRKKKVEIDVSKMSLRDSSFYISPNVYQKQIEKQLPSSMTLLDFDRDTIFFDLLKVISKTVPVVPRIKYTLENNYALADKLIVEPEVIKITGPKTEIDTIKEVRTTMVDLGTINADFSEKLSVIKARNLSTTTFIPSTVKVSGAIFRFSEKIIKVPVTIINLPNDVKVRTFPETVEIKCQGKIEDLKELKPEDFIVIADYLKMIGQSENIIAIRLQEYPEVIRNAHLLTSEIEYILRRE